MLSPDPDRMVRQSLASACRSRAASFCSLTALIGVILVTACVGCAGRSADVNPAGLGHPSSAEPVVLEVLDVEFLDMFWRGYSAAVGQDCPLEHNFHSFYRFDWSRDLRLGGFERLVPDSPYYLVSFEDGRIRMLRQVFPKGRSTVENVYEIDEQGRLARALTKYDPSWLGRGEPTVREVRVEYGRDSIPRRLIVSGQHGVWAFPELPDRVFVNYECDSDGRLISRKATDVWGTPIRYLRRGRAAREVLHYDEASPMEVVRSELFDEHGKPIPDGDIDWKHDNLFQ